MIDDVNIVSVQILPTPSVWPPVFLALYHQRVLQAIQKSSNHTPCAVRKVAVALVGWVERIHPKIAHLNEPRCQPHHLQIPTHIAKPNAFETSPIPINYQSPTPPPTPIELLNHSSSFNHINHSSDSIANRNPYQPSNNHPMWKRIPAALKQQAHSLCRKKFIARDANPPLCVEPSIVTIPLEIQLTILTRLVIILRINFKSKGFQ